MSELLGEKNEKLPAAEAITEAMEDWLLAEVEESRIGRNAVLDNIYRPNFIDGGKREGHFNRLVLWTRQFANESHHDYMTARQLFATQMKLSGLFRIQCRILASSQEDYEQRRFGNYPSGINIGRQVNYHLNESAGSTDLASKTIGLERLVADTLRLNEEEYDSLGRLPNQTNLRRIGNYIKLQRMQREWLDLSTDYIIYAAQVREGNLAAVPFLEPKSISENPQTYYPFAGK